MFTLADVVPWGRSYEEYARMFALSDADLSLRILGCADGPASFNAHATTSGARVVSCDPIYRWSAEQIAERIASTREEILEQSRRNAHEFVWAPPIASVEDLGRVRGEAMDRFLSDYERGREEGRYMDAELPRLPFLDQAFDLALCSHFLFLYSEQLGEPFHQAAIDELCRVADEVRIFPLLALGGERSAFVDGCTPRYRSLGYAVDLVTVPYEFQRGANQMMRIRRVN
jgi:hypothetical protein